MTTKKTQTLLQSVIRALLLLFPEDVRGITRAAMEETVRDRWRAQAARTGSHPVSFVAREIWSLFSAGLAARLDSLSPLRPLAGFRDDFRFVVRSLLKHPSFTLGAVVMLALGIGVNAATFGLARGMVGVAQRFEDPDELVFVWRVERQWDESRWSLPGYRELEEGVSAFEELGAYQGRGRYVTGDGEPLRTVETRTTPNLLPMLGLDAAVGRLFGPADVAPSAPKVAVLTHRFWRDRYGGDTAVVGRTVRLDDVPHAVIGVLPEKVEFELLWRGTGVFTPLPLEEDGTDWAVRPLAVMARLAEGTSVALASAQVAAVSDQQVEAHPATHAGLGARVETFDDYFLAPADRLVLRGLQAAVIAVLLIACINLANLLMAKGADRQSEVAIRLAMGASRSRMVRHLLSESLLLALTGGALGIVLGLWAVQLIASATPGSVLLPSEIAFSWNLFFFALFVAVGAALTFGLTPAVLATRTSLGVGVRETGAGGSSGSGRKRFRSGLLLAQLALTVPLVATSAIAYVNLMNLQNTDFGFSVERLLTARVELPPYRYPVDQQASFFREALEAVRGVPDVVSASAGMGVPIGAGWEVSRGDFLVPGREDLEAGERGPRAFQAVVPGYFETLGVSFRGGRGFNDADGPDDAPVAVVNEALARRYWPDEDAIGQVLLPDPEGRPGDPGTASAPELPLTVVGVVSDFGASFRGDPPSPMLYLPQAQRPRSSLVLVARTRGDPLLTVSAVRATVRRVDPDVPVSAFETGEAMVDRWLRESRTTGVALGVLALLALGLAVIGLYGLVAYSVSRRTFELGVRMVLGADRWAIRLSVMRYFLVLAGLGLSIGLALSVAAGMVARSLLVRLQVSFVPVAAGLTAILTGVVLLASYLPARRATGIEPVIALKSE